MATAAVAPPVALPAAAPVPTMGPTIRVPEPVPYEVEQRFTQLCSEIESLFASNKMGSVSNGDKLFLYSRYKQATEGDQITPRSRAVNLRSRAMWDAWDLVKGRSRAEMMAEYNAKAEEVIRKCKSENKGAGSVVAAFKSVAGWVGRKGKKGRETEDDLRDRTINEGLRRFGIPFEPSEDITVRFDKIRTFLEDNDFFSYYLPFEGVFKNTAMLNHRELVQFSSYSYLNLMSDPRLAEAGVKAMQSHGLGSHGTRSLAGTTTLHVQLEATIAQFVGKEMSLTFSTAYLANIATIGALCRRSDFILLDQKAHRSLQDGCQLSRATVLKFQHNSLTHCTELLATIRHKQAKQKRKNKTVGRIFLVSDTVFSMDGDIFPLPRFYRFCKDNDITLILDEAHGLGVIGATGRGIEEHFNMPGSVDILTGTLGKSIPAIGGFCAGSKKDMRYIQMYGNPCIFSSPMPPFYCGVAQAAFEILQTEPQHVSRLQANARYFIGRLKAEGFNTGDTETAVVPLIMGNVEHIGLLYRELRDRGFWVAVIIPPAVAIGSSRLRLIPHSGFEFSDLDRFVEALKEIIPTLA